MFICNLDSFILPKIVQSINSYLRTEMWEKEISSSVSMVCNIRQDLRKTQTQQQIFSNGDAIMSIIIMLNISMLVNNSSQEMWCSQCPASQRCHVTQPQTGSWESPVWLQPYTSPCASSQNLKTLYAQDFCFIFEFLTVQGMPSFTALLRKEFLNECIHETEVMIWHFGGLAFSHSLLRRKNEMREVGGESERAVAFLSMDFL